MDVFNAYTGKVSHIRPEDVVSLQKLGEILEKEHNVPASQQLLLLAPSASQLKLETVTEGQRVFLYDRQLLSDEQLSRSRLDGPPSPAEPRIGDAPRWTAVPESEQDSQLAVSQMFIDRSAWALENWDASKKRAARIEQLRSEILVIDRAVQLALTHMNIHLRNLVKNVDKRVKSADDLAHDVQSCNGWAKMWDTLETIPAVKDKLPQLFDKQEITRSYEQAEQTVTTIYDKLGSIQHRAKTIEARGARVLKSARSTSVPETGEGVEALRKDIEILAKKVVGDIDGMRNKRDQRDTRSREGQATAAVHMLKGHDLEIIPEMESALREQSDLEERWRSAKRVAQDQITQVLLEVSRVQLESTKLKGEISKFTSLLEQCDQYKVQVARVIDLPFMIGVIIMELMRRQDWVLETNNLGENVKVFLKSQREQEYDRIDKWQNRYSSFGVLEKLTTLDIKLPEVDVKVIPGSGETLPITLTEYLEQLRTAGLYDIVDDLDSELKAMTAHRARRSNSNPLETSIQSSVRYETRIRKLESLLLQSRLESQQKHDSKALSDSVEAAKAEVHEQAKQHAQEMVSSEVSLLRAQLADVQKQLESEKLAKEASLAQTKAIAETEQQKTLIEKELELSRENQRKLEAELNSIKEKEAENAALIEKQAKELASLNDGRQQLERRVASMRDKNKDVSQRLYANTHNLDKVLANMGLQASKYIEDGNTHYVVSRVKGLGRRSSRTSRDEGAESTETPSADPAASQSETGTERERRDSEIVDDIPSEDRETPIPDPAILNWVDQTDQEGAFQKFIDEIYIDYDIYRDAVVRRFGDVEKVARKYHAEVKTYRDRVRKLEQSLRQRLALNQFDVGDLILFLPTRDPERTPNPWAAFNVNAPHYFLDPTIASQLQNREYLIARATAITQFQVGAGGDNPFGLPEGMKWNMIGAQWAT